MSSSTRRLRAWSFAAAGVALALGSANAGTLDKVRQDKALRIAYRDDAHGASILLNGRCHRPDEATPLLALTNHLLIGATAREIVTQETVPFDGREALHTKLRAKWDGVPIAFDIFVAKKDGCTYDFVYMGDPAAYDEGSRGFESFVGGFRTLPGSGLVPGGPRG